MAVECERCAVLRHALAGVQAELADALAVLKLALGALDLYARDLGEAEQLEPQVLIEAMREIRRVARKESS